MHAHVKDSAEPQSSLKLVQAQLLARDEVCDPLRAPSVYVAAAVRAGLVIQRIQLPSVEIPDGVSLQGRQGRM